jgi:hypothetical protein
MDVQRDDEQGRTQRHEDRALGSLRWAEPAETTGYISAPAFEGRLGLDNFHFTRSRAAPHGFDAAAARGCESASAGCQPSHFLLGSDLAPARIDDLGGSP